MEDQFDLVGRASLEDAVLHFQDGFSQLLASEQEYAELDSNFPEQTVDPKTWRSMAERIIWTHERFDLGIKTLFLAVRITHRFLRRAHCPYDEQVLDEPRQRLLCSASLVLASKFLEEVQPASEDLVKLAEYVFNQAEMMKAEVRILQVLDFRVSMPTAAHHIDWFYWLGAGGPDHLLMIDYMAQLALLSHRSGLWSPRDHAAAAVLVTNVLMRRTVWPPLLAELLGVPGSGELRRGSLPAVVKEVWETLAAVKSCDQLFRMYSGEQQYFTAETVQRLFAERLKDAKAAADEEKREKLSGRGSAAVASASMASAAGVRARAAPAGL